MPVMVNPIETIENEQIKQQIIKLYHNDSTCESGEKAYEQLLQENNQCYYVALFNDKIIGGITSQVCDEVCTLGNLAIHPANRGRGIEQRLIEETCRLEQLKGVKSFITGTPQIQTYLDRLNN